MNKMLKSAIVIGAGMAAYNYARKNDLMSRKNMKRMQKTISRVLP